MTAEKSETATHYNRAPIVQATLDFLCEKISDEKVPSLSAVVEELAEDYPEIVEPAKRNRERSSAENWQPHRSSDGLRVINPRATGFSFSHMAPYDTWEAFSDEGRRTWTIYARLVGPLTITGLTVRYVNKFRIPLGMPLHEFFNIYPAMPDRDVLFNKMLLLTEIDTIDPPGTVTTLMSPSGEEVEEEHFSMMLDNQFRFAVTDESAIWKSLPKIRILKNAVFNDQMTDKLKETIA